MSAGDKGCSSGVSPEGPVLGPEDGAASTHSLAPDVPWISDSGSTPALALPKRESGGRAAARWRAGGEVLEDAL